MLNAYSCDELVKHGKEAGDIPLHAKLRLDNLICSLLSGTTLEEVNILATCKHASSSQPKLTDNLPSIAGATSPQ
eukprot:4654028-Pleurochrysis_carterae.AAC.1